MPEPTATEIDHGKTEAKHTSKDRFAYLDARDPTESLSGQDQRTLDDVRAMTLRRLERIERLVPHVPGHQAWADIQVPYLQQLAAYTQEHSATVADLNAVRFLDDEVLRYATYVDYQLRRTGFTETIEMPRAGILPSEDEIETDDITAEDMPTEPQPLQEPESKTPEQLRAEMFAQQPDIEGDQPVFIEPRDVGQQHTVSAELNRESSIGAGELLPAEAPADAVPANSDEELVAMPEAEVTDVADARVMPMETPSAEIDQEVASRDEILDRFKQWVEREAIMVERYRAASGEDRVAAETRLQRIRNIIDHYLEEAGYQIIRKSSEGRILEASYLDSRLALPLETGRARVLAMKEHQAERFALERANTLVVLEQQPKPATKLSEQLHLDRARIFRELNDSINNPPTFGYEKWFQHVTTLAEGLYNVRQGGEQDAYQFWLSAARNLEAHPARWFTGRWEQRKQLIDEQRKRYLDVVREQNKAKAA